MSARARAMHGGGATVESRLAALEHNVNALTEDMDARFGDQKRRLQELQTQVNQVAGDLNRQIEQQERDRRTALQESVAFQAWGTVLFVVGLAFQFAGSACSG